MNDLNFGWYISAFVRALATAAQQKILSITCPSPELHLLYCFGHKFSPEWGCRAAFGEVGQNRTTITNEHYANTKVSSVFKS
jgi:hypothetical protein